MLDFMGNPQDSLVEANAKHLRSKTEAGRNLKDTSIGKPSCRDRLMY
jgi:hypothetical protein